jgi:hypothetical protein
MLRTESSAGSTSRLLMILEVFFGLQADQPVIPGSPRTARQFARDVVSDRSRILHGTWSTLNTRLANDRNGMEGFVITVVRRAAFELDRYAHSANPADDIESFLTWLKAQTAAPAGA